MQSQFWIARSIGARDITTVLEKVIATCGQPAIIHPDNGREFIAVTVTDWRAEHGMRVARRWDFAETSPRPSRVFSVWTVVIARGYGP